MTSVPSVGYAGAAHVGQGAGRARAEFVRVCDRRSTSALGRAGVSLGEHAAGETRSCHLGDLIDAQSQGLPRRSAPLTAGKS